VKALPSDAFPYDVPLRAKQLCAEVSIATKAKMVAKMADSFMFSKNLNLAFII